MPPVAAAPGRLVSGRAPSSCRTFRGARQDSPGRRCSRRPRGKPPPLQGQGGGAACGVSGGQFGELPGQRSQSRREGGSGCCGRPWRDPPRQGGALSGCGTLEARPGLPGRRLRPGRCPRRGSRAAPGRRFPRRRACWCNCGSMNDPSRPRLGPRGPRARTRPPHPWHSIGSALPAEGQRGRVRSVYPSGA